MKKLILSLTILCTLASCDNYLDVNKDQTNNPFTSQVLPNQNLAAALTGYTNTQVITLNNYGNKMSYAYGINFGFTTTDAAYNYIYSSSSYSSIWEGLYLNIDNLQDILDKEALYPAYTNHYAVAKAMKVLGMQYIVALYGDAPYSEAFDHINKPYPKFDDDKAIYPVLFDELDEARDMLLNPSADAIALGSEDVVFNGDTSKWVQFINTLELKMLLRLSNTTDASLIALRNQRFATLNPDFITDDVAVNPGYNNSTDLQFTPMYRLFGINLAKTAYTSSNRSNAAGDFMAKVLNGTVNDANLTTGLVDPRRTRMFNVIGGVVVGNVHGSFPTATISRLGGFVSGLTLTGTTVSTTAAAQENGITRDAYLMLAAESYFLQAEAYEKGYLSGSAQTAFNDGITASFNFYNRNWGTTTIAAINPATYIAAIDSKNGLGWTGSTNKISAIMTQKWLALSQWTGIEPYLDNLRTGYPVLPLPVGVTEIRRPNRLIYPTSSYSSNSANVPSVSNSDLFTVNSKTPVYLQ